MVKIRKTGRGYAALQDSLEQGGDEEEKEEKICGLKPVLCLAIGIVIVLSFAVTYSIVCPCFNVEYELVPDDSPKQP